MSASATDVPIDSSHVVAGAEPNLRAPGAVLLLSCYELGHQPSGLSLPLAFLQRAGFAPAVLDLAVQELDEDAVRAARFVGISVPMHTALRLGVRAAERVRELNEDCHLCFYGLYALLNAEYLLNNLGDSVIGGEFEEPLVALVSALDSENRSLPPELGGRGGFPGGLPGVTLRQQAASATTAPASLQRLDFPPPSRDALPPLARYAHLEQNGEQRPAGYLEASRGCKHGCRHCPIPPVYGRRFFVVPQDVLLDDLRRQVEAGAQHVTFGDPDFLNGPGHALRVVRALHAQFPDLTFDCTVKIEHLLQHRALLPELRACGCVFIVSAVESLNDRVLERLDKGHTRANVIEALKAVRAAGISLRPSLVPFTPWETLESYLDLLHFVAKHDLIDAVDPVHYTIRLLVPPGSLLLNDGLMDGSLGPLDPAAFSHTWTHPDPRMDQLQQELSAVVEASVRDNSDAATTFRQVWTTAHRVAGIHGPAPEITTSPTPGPRLTESWFC